MTIAGTDQRRRRWVVLDLPALIGWPWALLALVVLLAGSALGVAEVPKVGPAGVVIHADDGERLQADFGGVVRLKVGPDNSGATQLMLGTVDLPTGSAIPTHRHDRDEEVLFVVNGVVTLTLNDRELQAKTGDIVFIPVGTWMTVHNRGDTPARVMAIIPRAEMEQCLRLIHGERGASGRTDHEAIHAICQTSTPPRKNSK